MGAHPLYGALSQQGLSQPDGQLKLTASAFNRLWTSMPAMTVLVAVPTVILNSLHHLSTSSITARHLLEFMVQGKITEAGALTIRLDATPSALSVPLPSSSPHVYTKCPFCHDPPNLPWLATGTE